MQFFSILLTLYLCNRAVRIDKCPCMFARAFSSFQRTLYLCDDKSVVLLCRLMCMSEKLFCFVQMNKANEKSFRSIRRNEWTQCSPHLRRHWSRPIEQHGEISLSHLLRTTVPLILTCFCLHGRQLTPYVDCVSARFLQVTNLGDYWLGALTALPKKEKAIKETADWFSCSAVRLLLRAGQGLLSAPKVQQGCSSTLP